MSKRGNTVIPNGQRVRELRRKKPLTQEKLAFKAEVSKSSIERIERGHPTYISTLELVAGALSVKANELLASVKSKRKPKSKVKDKLQAIEQHFKKQLKARAMNHLLEKLQLKSFDHYQPLAMELGFVQTKKDETGSESPVGQAQPHPIDHNRSWKHFNPDDLLEPQGIYILSSDTGTGKTTFLRHLQLRMLEQNRSLPILLHASQLEGLEFEDENLLIAHLINILKVKVPKKWATKYLKNLFKNKRITLIIDGLDQIEGAGTDYRDLLNNLLHLFGTNFIVASRPFAVTNQEQNRNVNFLRLRPFSDEAQEKYFDKYYNRARELCISSQELMAVPMLAYMVRSLIEKKQDKNVKNRADLYKRFIDYILMEYRHDKIRSSEDKEIGVRQALAQISYEALANKSCHIQKIPLAFCHKYTTNYNLTLGNLLRHGLVKLIVDKSRGIDKFLYFSHQSFQEYLAAKWAHNNEIVTKDILDEMWNPKWKETIKFLAGLKEDFIKKIYEPGCNDNCIHSRLFLAAECGGEIGQASEIKKAIFRYLKDLLSQDLFSEDAIIAIYNLNDSDSMEFLIRSATGRVPFGKRAVRQKIRSHILKLIPLMKHKLLPKHFDYLIDLLEGNDKLSDFITSDMLEMLADCFTADQISRLINILCKERIRTKLSLGRILCFAKESSISHIELIINHAECRDESIAYRALKCLGDLTGSLHAKCLSYQGFQDTSGYIEMIGKHDFIKELEVRHIQRLIKCTQNRKKKFEHQVVIILSNLAEHGIVLPNGIDWIVGVFRNGSNYSREKITNRISILSSYFLPSHVEQIFDLLEYSSDKKLQLTLKVIYHIADKITKKHIAKIISLLQSDISIRELVIDILGRVHWSLTSKQVNIIIDSLASPSEFLSDLAAVELWSAMRTLSLLSRTMNVKQINRTLRVLKKAPLSLEYYSTFQMKPNDICSDLPQHPIIELSTKSHFEIVSNFLDDLCKSRKKLGIELLASMREDLPTRYINMIIKLLSQEERDVTLIALRALQVVHDKLSISDISKILSCLSSPYHEIRKAATFCIIEGKIELASEHIERLMILLQKKDIGVIEEVLLVLSRNIGKLSNRDINKVIDVLKNLTREKDVHYVTSLIAGFAERFGSREINDLAQYVQGNYVSCQKIALEILSIAGKNLPDNIIYLAIKRLYSRNIDVRTRAAILLNAQSHQLTADHVNRIVEAYSENPTMWDTFVATLGIPPALLAGHCDRFISLLDNDKGDKKSDIKSYALTIIDHSYKSLKPCHLQKISNLLNRSKAQIRLDSYKILKKAYTVGLPIPPLSNCSGSV